MPVDTSDMPMQLTTALGAGVLNFKSMSALEEISRPFEFQIIAVAEDQAIATDDLLGTPAASRSKWPKAPSAGSTGW
jgi:uncharacterized protein involved in type VI secretion and phage assembly